MPRFRHTRLSVLLFAISLLTISAWDASGVLAQDSYEVGDEIRCTLMRKEVTGVITKVLPRQTGFWVDVNQDGDRFLPRRTVVRLKDIIGPVESESDDADGVGEMEEDEAPIETPTFKRRIWKDKTGKHQIVGTFVDLSDGVLTIRDPKGDSRTIKLAMLDPADAAIAEEQKALMAENPFAGGVASTDSKDVSEADAAADYVMKEMDFDKTKVIKVQAGDDSTSAGVVRPMLDFSGAKRKFQLPVKGRYITVDHRRPDRVYICDTEAFKGIETGCIVDLKSGKQFGPFTFPKKHVRVVAFDSTTNRLITKTGLKVRDNPSIDVWKLNGNEVEHVFGFLPSSGRDTYVSAGAFLDGERVMLTSLSKAGIFNLKTLQAEAAVAFRLGQTAIDPSGTHLIGSVDDRTAIFSGKELKTVGFVGQKLPSRKGFGFNHAMTKVAIAQGERLVIYDLASGEIEQDLFFPGRVVSGATPVFLDDENILLTRFMYSNLVNIRLKTCIWQYMGGTIQHLPGTSKLIGVGNHSLTLLELPQPAALEVIDSLSPENLLAIPPGSEVCFDGSLRGNSVRVLTDRLENQGYRVVRNSRYEFRTTVNRGKSETKQYKGIGGARDETVTIKNESYEIALYNDGEKVWFRRGGSGGSDPGDFVQLESGESVQGRINQSQGTPDGFFSSVTIPDVFIKTPPNGHSYGNSNIEEL